MQEISLMLASPAWWASVVVVGLIVGVVASLTSSRIDTFMRGASLSRKARSEASRAEDDGMIAAAVDDERVCHQLLAAFLRNELASVFGIVSSTALIVTFIASCVIADAIAEDGGILLAAMQAMKLVSTTGGLAVIIVSSRWHERAWRHYRVLHAARLRQGIKVG